MLTARDRAMLAEIAEGRFYVREQLQALFFQGVKSPVKAQERLRKLFEAKEVKRKKIGSQGGYIYYMDNWSDKWRHWVTLNWAKVCLVQQAKSWQKVSVFKREYVYNDIRSDAFVVISNTVTKRQDRFFVEIDLHKNTFIDKYAKVAESLEFALERPWWYRDEFPGVLVVTTRPGRVQEVVDDSKVRYSVVTLDDIRRDIYGVTRFSRATGSSKSLRVGGAAKYV